MARFRISSQLIESIKFRTILLKQDFQETTKVLEKEREGKMSDQFIITRLEGLQEQYLH